MGQSISHKHEIGSLISNDTFLVQPKPTAVNSKNERHKIICNECKSKRRRNPSDENPQICQHCYKAKKLRLSGNKVIDDFIRYTRTNNTGARAKKMRFFPYDKFQNIEFIAEGG